MVMEILTWDLLLISVMVATAAILVAAGLMGIRTHRAGRDRAPEGTMMALILVAMMVGLATLVILVAMKVEIVTAEIKATMVTGTETRMLPVIPKDITTPRTLDTPVKETRLADRARGTASE